MLTSSNAKFSTDLPPWPLISHLIGHQQIGPGNFRPVQQTFIDLAQQLVAGGPVRDAINAAIGGEFSGLMFTSTAERDAFDADPELGPIPLYRKFLIQFSGDEAVDGIWRKTPSGFVREGPLDTTTAAMIEELAATIEALARKPIPLVEVDVGTSAANALKATSPAEGDPNETNRTFWLSTGATPPNAAGAVTLSVNDETPKPFLHWNGAQWPADTVPRAGHMLVRAGVASYRCLTPIGVPVPKAAYDRIPIDLGAATRTDEGDFDIYTVVSDEATANPFQNGKRYTVTLPSANTKPKPKLRIKRSNGDLVDQTEIEQGPGSWALKIGALPAGKHDLAGNGTKVMTMNPLGRDNSSIDADVIAVAVEGKLDASVFEQFVVNEQAALARVDEVAADMEGAVATAKGVLYPERPGSGWASTVRDGDVDAALTAIVPALWCVDDAELGLSAEAKGSRIEEGQTSIVIRRPDLIPVEAGRIYDGKARLRRSVDSNNPSDDVVRAVVVYLDIHRSVLSEVYLFNNVSSVANGVRSVTKRFAFEAGDGVDFVIPSAAAYVVMYGEAFGGTPTTRFSLFSFRDVTDLAPGGADYTGVIELLNDLQANSVDTNLSNVVPDAGRGALGAARADGSYFSAARAGISLVGMPAATTSILTGGHAENGDGGGAVFRREDVDPGLPTPFSIPAPAIGKWFVNRQKRITAEMAGAKGDSATWDDAAFENLVDYANQIGGGLKVDLAGSYKIGDPHIFTQSNIELDFAGAGRIDASAASLTESWALLHFAGAGQSHRTTLAASAIRQSNGNGANTLVLADAAGYQAGDIVAITSLGEYWSGIAGLSGGDTRQKGELAIVQSVDLGTDTLTLAHNLRDTYDAVTHTVYVRRLTMLDNIRVKGGRWRGSGHGADDTGANPPGVRGLRFDCVKGLVLDALYMENFNRFAIVSNLGLDHKGIGLRIDGRRLSDASNLPTISSWFTGWWAGGVKGMELVGCSALACRRLVDPDGMEYRYFDDDPLQDVLTHDVVITGGRSLACVSGPGGHLYDNMIVDGHMVDGRGAGTTGIIHRGRHLRVTNTVIKDVSLGVGLGYGSPTYEDPASYAENPSAGYVHIDADIFGATWGVYATSALDGLVLRGRVLALRPVLICGKKQENIDISAELIGTSDDYPIIDSPYATKATAKQWRIHGCTLKSGTIGVQIASAETPAENVSIEGNTFIDISTNYVKFAGADPWGANIVVKDNHASGAPAATPITGVSGVAGFTESNNPWNLFRPAYTAAPGGALTIPGQLEPFADIRVNAAASETDITSIVGGRAGQTIIVGRGGATDVVLKNNASLILGSDITLRTAHDRVVLVKSFSATWTTVEKRRSDVVLVEDFRHLAAPDDDLPMLQAARDAAGVGGKVILEFGVKYVVSAMLALSVAEQIWDMQGAAIEAGPNIADTSIVYLTGNKTRIQNGFIFGASADQDTLEFGLRLSTGCEADHMVVSDTRRYGIVANNASRVKIKDCSVSKFSMTGGVSCGIWVQNIADTSYLSDIEVTGCIIDVTDKPANFAGAGAIIRGTVGHPYQGVKFTGNTVRQIDGDGSSSLPLGVEIRYARTPIVTGNNFFGGSMGPSVAYCDGPVVANNTIEEATHYGIEMPSCNNASITGNTINLRGAGLDGIAVQGTETSDDGVVISGNTIVGFTRFGVFVDPGWTEVMIGMNRIYSVYSSDTFVYLNGATRASIIANRVRGGVSSKKGIRLHDTSDAVVALNHIENFTEQGILLTATDTTVDEVLISGNQFKNCPTKFAKSTTGSGAFGANVNVSGNPGLRDEGPLDAVRVEIHTISGTFTKQAGDKTVRAIAIAPGGGAGSGGLRGPGVQVYGGGGGAAGTLVEKVFDAATLASSEAITIQAPGVGGAAVTATDANGNPGTAGGLVLFGSGRLTARGGAFGGGGGAVAGAGGSFAGNRAFPPSPVVSAGAGGANSGGVAGEAAGYGPGHGGGGGGVNAADTPGNGGSGSNGAPAVMSIGVTAGGAAPGGDGTTGADTTAADYVAGGNGGGGGAANASGDGGDGGNGGLYGAGGGGGGAARNGFTSGKGGNGGAGVLMLIVTK
ncbi:right-handed parallel beta-helix repeat-containing protein [Hansschlegelia zhihuaiae]|uniref:right-handed parallel beta-helix repeat-containing protein n=1 Tax=Hansschlegelia zhihuaiae TaxID=405005 RepID=UPI0013E8C5D7|nr:right-handed parallel beta-helix repeat-containing protein [Hansschlegelia zhihuaiae]